MPFNFNIPIFSSRPTQHQPAHEPSGHAPGQGNQQPRHHSRVQSAFINYAQNRSAGLIESFLSHSTPSSNNFWGAMRAETGWDPAAFGQSHEAAGHGHRPPPTDNFGASLHRSFSNLFDVIPSRLEAFLQNRPQQIVNELEDFKQRLTEFHHSGRTGTPPAPPQSVPSHIRNLMLQLDPTDPDYEQTVLDMVRADGDVQQRAREQQLNNIGNAPRPRPGHEHGESGGAYEPELAPNGEPLFEESADYDRPIVYETQRPQPAPSDTRTRQYQQPSVRDAQGDDDGRAPIPPRN